MFVLLRYRDAAIRPLLDEALAALAAAPGCEAGWVGRAPDDPEAWVLASRWADAGALRRGLGSYAAKMALGPLQAYSTGDDTVVEVLAEVAAGQVRTLPSDLAPDAGRAGPGRPSSR